MKPLIIVFIISALYLSYQLIRSRRPKHWLIVSSSLSLAVIVSFQFLGGVFLIPTEWHCCKVSDEAAFCLIQRPYISKTLLTRRISPRGSP
ncbi:hypothetical protein C2U53_17970 [Citrobacter sp. CFNIH10]|nr:hypothetical protein C2U53_17970 [Citrobacter sp. CFNIH10]